MTASPDPRTRRILGLWLPALGAERALRRAGGAAPDPDAPFAVVEDAANALRLISVNESAAALGLGAGMALTEARAIHPALATVLRDPGDEARVNAGLLRWAGRYSPWVAAEDCPAGQGGLALDITGCAHLFGGEAGLAARMRQDLAALGLSARAAIADTRGAAWALARFSGGARGAAAHSGDAIAQDAPASRVKTPKRRAAAPKTPRKGWERGRARPAPAAAPDPAAPGMTGQPPVIVPQGGQRAALAALPVTALRIPDAAAQGLARLGLRRIGDLLGLPRGALARRFGADLMLRLDQALGAAPDPISPTRAAPVFAVRLTLPEPIGLRADIEAALERLLTRLCARLEAEQMGARRLRLAIRRVDRESQAEELGLARPSRDPDRIRPLFATALERLEAGFGVDAVRLEAVAVEPLAARQHRGHAEARADADARAAERGIGQGGAAERGIGQGGAAERGIGQGGAGFADLLGRIGARIGLERLTRFQPADSHIPEKTAHLAAAAYATAATGWPAPAMARPALLFAPEPLAACAPGRPPRGFRWRGRDHRLRAVAGPERIAPEWWLDDPAWRGGARDYWRVETETGARFWLFEALGGAPNRAGRGGWFAQGIFA